MHADVSWDVLSKQLLMNYDPKVHNISLLHEVIFILVVMVIVVMVVVVVIVVAVYPTICYVCLYQMFK